MLVEYYFDENRGMRFRAVNGNTLVLHRSYRSALNIPVGHLHPLIDPEPLCYVPVTPANFDDLYTTLFEYVSRCCHDASFVRTAKAFVQDVHIRGMERDFLLEVREEFRKMALQKEDLSDICDDVLDERCSA